MAGTGTILDFDFVANPKQGFTQKKLVTAYGGAVKAGFALGTRPDGYLDPSIHPPLGLLTSLHAPGFHLASLPNGNFEDGLAGWTYTLGASTTNTVTVDATKANVLSGTNAIKLFCPDKANAVDLISPKFGVSESVPFEVTLRYLSNVNATSGVALYPLWLDAAGNAISQPGVVPPNGGALSTSYQVTKVVLRPPAGARFCQIYFVVTGQVATVWVDEIQIRRGLRSFVDVREFGAVSDSSTDSTAAIQAAINFAIAYGYAGVDCTGTYSTSAAIVIAAATTGLRFGGLSGRCRLIASVAGQAGLVVGNPTKNDGTVGVGLVNLTLTASLTKTAGVGLAFYYTYKCYVRDCTVAGHFAGALCRGNSFMNFDHNEVSGAATSQALLQIDGGEVAGYYSKNNITGSSTQMPNFGILIYGYDASGVYGGAPYTQGCYITDNSVSLCNYACYMTGGGKNIENMFFRKNAFDNSNGPGLYVIAAQGENIRNCTWEGDWFTTNSRGVYLNTSGTGLITNNQFTAIQVFNNQYQGILTSGNVTETSFIGGHVSGNGLAQTNTYDGIYVGPGATGLAFAGIRSKQMGTWAQTQRYGMAIDSGAGDYISTTGCHFYGNNSGPGLADLRTQANIHPNNVGNFV